jgi:hypothetical protein
MSKTFVNWASRVTIVARVAERRRPQISNELTTPGDYHLPFGKVEAQTKAAKWLWQAYII